MGGKLTEIRPLYLFLDGIAARLTPGVRREAVLCAWAITWEGKKVLVHLAPGTKESTECCREFLEELKRRGLADPVLVVTDGAAGLIRAVEECFPRARRQRCLAHKMRNLLAKAPEALRAELRDAAKAAYHAPSPALAQALREDLVARFEREAPGTVRCFEEDFEAAVRSSAESIVPADQPAAVALIEPLQRPHPPLEAGCASPPAACSRVPDSRRTKGRSALPVLTPQVGRALVTLM